MSEETLFPMADLSAPKDAATSGRAAARVRLPVRNQVETIVAALDDLVAD
jgi:hypothetical protein